MPVAGYNVKPDENDDHVIDVELEHANDVHQGKACIYIDEEEIHLDYYELCALIGQAKFVRLEMEWNMAKYAYASEYAHGKTHLVRKGNAPLERTPFSIEPVACKYEKSLCGRLAPTWTHIDDLKGWEIEPVAEMLSEMSTCKKCYAIWKKEQQGS